MALVYADGFERTGKDPNPKFDADDELVFMFKDAAKRAKEKKDPEGVLPNSRIEMRIADSQTAAIRFVYLFVSDGSLRPGADRKYVNYKCKILTGKSTGTGPNPEKSVVKTKRYLNRFSDRWIHDATHITVADATGVNILDREKFQFAPGICVRTEATFSRGDGAFIANAHGPIRAIRSVIGCNSGILTQRDYIFYEGRTLVRTYLRVHAIPGTWFFYDFSPAAKGMLYFDNLNAKGAVVDGKPDDMKTGILTWQALTGKQGTMTLAYRLDTNITNLNRRSHYFDNLKPKWKQCTGDEHAFAASGPATGFVPDTDAGSKNYFTLDRIAFYDAPNVTLDHIKGRVTAAWYPLRVENLSK